MSRKCLLIILAMLWALPLSAKQLSVEQVPEPLQPWVNWVLHDHETDSCPFIYNNFRQKRCSWPSRLDLTLSENNGKFSMQWKVFAPTWVTLPGDDKFWPQQVTVNSKAAIVLEKQGRPVIQLTAGTYHIEGQLLWDYLPDNFAIPKNSGLLKVQLNGEQINTPYIKQGRLWLKKPNNASNNKSVQNTLDLQVFRKVIDQVPLQVLTHLEMNVSGQQRETRLSLPMLAGFIAMHIDSPLPAKLEADGSLLVQLRPGRWLIEVMARYPEALTSVSFNSSDKTWPDTEIWSFSAQPYLRVVEIEQLAAIDPQQSNVPQNWRNLPAYQIKKGQSMVFKVLRRGDPDPEPNKLDLRRNLWLDFDGQGYTVQDKINGRMSQGWRLNVLPEMHLGRASLDGKNQLITRLPEAEQQGIEVRQGSTHLIADSRINDASNTLHATGWQETFHSVKAVLNLPPGWRLFAASGVDNVPQSWISRWTLLDLFLVLIAALAVFRMWNIYWGLFALFSLAMIWHEADAPRFIWLHILMAIALLRVLPEGRFFSGVKIYRNVCFLILVLISLPFMLNQVRLGLYPQLEKPWQSISRGQHATTTTDSLGQFAMAPATMEMEESVMSLSESKIMAKKTRPHAISPAPKRSKMGSLANQSVNFNRVDPKASVQTGPGMPQWQWQTIQLSWNGPVDQQQQMSFWLLSPTLSMLFNFTRIVVISVLALFMFGLINENIREKFSTLCSALFIIPLLMFIPQNSDAAFPEQPLLQTLQDRLLAAPDCLPSCAQVAHMQVKIDQQVLHVTLTIHVKESIAAPLPAHLQQWFPNQVLVNNNTAKGLYRDNKGNLWINLAPGTHRVELHGVAPTAHSFSLPLPLKTHRVEVDKQGWSVTGLHEHGQTKGQLQFNRLETDDSDETDSTQLRPGVLPAFVSVERTLQLGLDWRVSNRIYRQTAADTPLVLQVPLLQGEAVITPGVRVRDNKVQVNLPIGQTSMQWQSVLDKQADIEFKAVPTRAWSEIWRADVSPIWHLESNGLSVIHHQDKRGRWLPEWRPWPGETVLLSISRPEAVNGRTLTIEHSALRFKPGKRNQEVHLSLRIRSSQGGQHTLQLPEQVLLQSVMIDGRTQPIRLKEKQLTVPIKPGQQDIEINWRETSAISSILSTPAVNLGTASVNTYLSMDLGEDRWVLFTFGPTLGPAVLFWGVLIVIALLAFALGRVPLTPLQHWQWLLLLIGLSQIPIAAALVVVAWLMLLGLRAKQPINKATYFNAAQVGIGFLTLLSMLVLFVAVKQGLLGTPEMQITGNQSSTYHLNWYQDHSEAQLPTASIFSVPLYAYRLLMLAWSLWLAVSLLKWLKWGWECFSTAALWRKPEPKQSNPLVMPGKK